MILIIIHLNLYLTKLLVNEILTAPPSKNSTSTSITLCTLAGAVLMVRSILYRGPDARV